MASYKSCFWIQIMFACFPISGKSCQCELAPIHQRLSLSLSLSLSSSGAGGASQIYGSGISFWIFMSSIVCPAGNFSITRLAPSKSDNIGRCARMLIEEDDERVTRHQKCILGTTIILTPRRSTSNNILYKDVYMEVSRKQRDGWSSNKRSWATAA